MTTPPSHWPDGLLRVALTILAAAVVLYVAAKLIIAVWPVLAGIALAALLGFAAWSICQFRRSRW